MAVQHIAETDDLPILLLVGSYQGNLLLLNLSLFPHFGFFFSKECASLANSLIAYTSNQEKVEGETTSNVINLPGTDGAFCEHIWTLNNKYYSAKVRLWCV